MNTQKFSVKFNNTIYHCSVTKKGDYWVDDFEGTHYIDDAFDDEERRRLEHGLDLAIEKKIKKLKVK